MNSIANTHLLDALLARKTRIDEALRQARALSDSEQQQFLLEYLDGLEVDVVQPEAPAVAQPQAAHETAPPHQPRAVMLPPRMPTRRQTKVDQAESFVLRHPEGIKFSRIVSAINQKPGAAASTLQYVANKRGTITNRHKRWYPTAAAPIEKDGSGKSGRPGLAKSPMAAVPQPRRSTYREAILTVMVGGEPLETSAIFQGVRSLIPNAAYASVTSSVKRMFRRALLVSHGDGPNGRLYALPPVIAVKNGTRQSGFFSSKDAHQRQDHGSGERRLG